MIEKRAENIMIPEEANYQRTMKRDVEPYLRSYEKDGYIESYDKTAIYYRTYRIPQAKAGIVISHGFCEFAEKYREVIYYFLQNGYSVYVPEHRGHGYSDRIVVDGEKVHVEDYEQYVQDLHFFVKNVVEPTEKRKILFCHSMGGAIGSAVSRRIPTDLRCGNPVSTDAWDEHWKVSEVACESYRRFFLRDRKGNEICCRTEWFFRQTIL